MPDDLTVGGGGSIAVATTALFSHAQRLEQIERELEECARALGTIDRFVGWSLLTAADAPLSAARAERAIDDAAVQVTSAAGRSGQLAAALRLSADLYGATEATITRISQSLAAELGIGLGFLASTVGVLMLPGVLAALAGGAAGFALSAAINPTGTRRAVDGIGAWLGNRKEILSDPRLVELVRLSVMSADDVGGGLLHLPPPLVRMLGDDGLGIFGLDTSAATIVAAGGLVGVLRETPVRVAAVSTAASPAATGYADRAERIPTGEAQVRVDRYVMEGQPDRFEVYIGGTVDFSLRADDEPWDMTSDVTAIARGDPGAYRAVEAALEEAGVAPESEIVVTGYSQGGLIGSMLAASGDYDVRGLYTLGAPAAQVDVPTTIPWVAVEHTDDLVPAIGGTWAGADPVVVQREAFADRPLDDDYVLPAHQLSYYRETAALVDSADEQRLVETMSGFARIGAGADRVESTWFEASRVEPSR